MAHSLAQVRPPQAAMGRGMPVASPQNKPMVRPPNAPGQSSVSGMQPPQPGQLPINRLTTAAAAAAAARGLTPELAQLLIRQQQQQQQVCDYANAILNVVLPVWFVMVDKSVLYRNLYTYLQDGYASCSSGGWKVTCVDSHSKVWGHRTRRTARR